MRRHRKARIMTATHRPSAPTIDDTEAIRRLRESFARQQAAFAKDPYPSLAQRQEQLGALAAMMVGNRDRIRRAVSEDFSVHPELFTDLVEVLGVAGRAAYAAEQLANWMTPEARFTDPGLYGSAQAAIRYQPKGVVGNIVPWNFPFDLSVGPLVEMLAAGNRVILKPSEFTPACGELLKEMIAATFDEDRVTVVTGGVDLARAFSQQRWDHLLYTGNPEVGRLIAMEAAKNLVPVTLELGGKCPAVLAPDSVDATSVEQILGTKLIKNGQMCISVDYCLVPRNKIDDFVGLAQTHMAERAPSFSETGDCTGIITERHLDRLIDLLEEARDAGCTIVELEPAAKVDRASRRMPLSLILDPADDLGVMQEEIFGPILVVKPYDSIDEAITHVNEGERPLGLYVFAKDEAVADDVLTRTSSGGACVNTCAVQGALPALGFGGVGTSGNGRHHGIEGFREFSNPRGVVTRGEGDLIQALYPPYGEVAQAVVTAALNG
ncbi:aldehyde dehydrogenase family protein [Nocardia sp. NPDC051030]|uniref:aldehyde dehydrogenase family protein n=1 Tax=Nocardia sp. NPDC051030 TaxID=3155162 RepID=UPI003431ED88